MSSPYNAGRDGNVGSGFGFGAQADIDGGAAQVADLTHFAHDHNGSDGLNERDYRDADAKP